MKSFLHFGKATKAVFFFLMMSVVGVTNARAEQFTLGHLRYMTTGTNTVACIGHAFSSDEAQGFLSIPGSIFYQGQYWRVTSVSGFAGYTRITGLGLPNSITRIGNYAFSGCTGLSGNLNLPSSLTSIGIEAFWGCTGMSGTLVIPESVTDIDITAFAGTHFSTVNWNAVNCNDITCGYTYFYGYYIYGGTHHYGLLSSCPYLYYMNVGPNVQRLPEWAFYGCSHLTTMVSQAENPPTISNNVFNGVNTNNNVRVPCGRSNAYQNAIGWGAFTIVESSECEYLITGLADPTYAGTVTGSGTYNNGSECTLTANPNTGYYFVVWTEDGSQVSTDATYTFSVNQARLLVAHFQQHSYTINVSHFPSAGGSVTGGGTFVYGTSCTVTATPNTGFLFVNWTEDGIQVSTDESYTFDVMDSRNLVANFVLEDIGTDKIEFADINTKYVCIENWDTNGDGELSYDEAAAVTSIGTAFENNKTVTSFNELQYFTGITTLVGGNTSHVVLNQIITSPYGAFHGCSNLTSIVIPDNVTSIDRNAFYSCTSLTSIEIPSQMALIGERAFNGCTGLESMTVLAETPPTLGNNVFYNVNKGIPVYVPCVSMGTYQYISGWNEFTFYHGLDCNYHEITASANPTEGGNVVGGGTYVQGASCTLTATSNQGYAFENWTENNEVVSTSPTITFTVTEDRALTANFSQTNPNDIITFADANVKALCVANWDINGDGELSYYEAASVPDLGTVFARNSTITSFNELQYFTGLSYIQGYYAFVNVGNNTMQEQAFGAFARCTNLTSIIIPNSVKSLYCAFDHCESLTTIELPNSITSIGKGTFFRCYDLTSIDIPNSVTEIDANAFYECTSLTTVSIGSSVATIANNVFSGCSNMLSLTIRAVTPPTLGSNVFNNVPKTIPVNVFTGVISAYQAAAGWNEFTNYQGMVGQDCDISVTINPTEGGTVTGCGTYVQGETCTLTAIPNTGYYFLNWTENGIQVSTDTTYSFGVSGERNLVANFTNSSHITFADANVKAICIANWDTDGDGELNYNEAASVTDVDYVFSNNTSITSFDEFQYFTGVTTLKGYSTGHMVGNIYIVTHYGAFRGCSNLTSIILPNTITSISNNVFLSCGSLVSIEIPQGVTALGSQAFYNCTGLASIILNPATPPTINASVFYNVDKSIPVYIPCGSAGVYSAATGWSEFTNFVEYCPVEIVVTTNLTEGGTVDGGGTYDLGDSCTITATPNFGYVFLNWTHSDTLVSTETTYTFIVTEAGTYVANYGLSSYSIEASANPTEGGAVTGGGTYNHGDSCTLTAVPNEGFAFINWSEDGTEVTTDTVYTFTVTSERTLVANFGINNYDVTASANPTEGGTVTGGGALNHGDSCTMIATANEGYTFINWTDNGNHVSTDVEYTFTVTGARTLVANFSLNIYSVSASANPEEGGNVTGGGTYNHGDSCTLTAISDEGYAFVNWTEDNEEVSTDTVYTFNVTGNRNLIANFEVLESITNHWTPESAAYADNMVLVGIIMIDGEEQYTDMLEVGAFCGDECRGSAIASEFDLTHRYLVMMMVYGEGNDLLTFKIYDHSLNQELDLTSPMAMTFDNDGYGTPVEPYVLSFTTTVVHTQSLIQGWNWYSTYIEQNDVDGLTMLENSLGDAGIRIQGRNGYTEQFEYQGTKTWYGTLTSITNEQMYKIRTNAACNAVMTGAAANPADHPITINSGWNWIGMPLSASASVASAMSDFTPEANDVIKGRNGAATYIVYGNTSMWYGTMNTLEPGQGYMYQSNSTTPKTLTFNSSREESSPSVLSDISVISALYDLSSISSYSDNMLVTAVIEINGEELRSSNYELAAFVDNECRGSVKLMYVEPLDRYLAMLLVFGDEPEDVHFVLTDGTETRTSNDKVIYTSDATIGTASNPTTLHFETIATNHDVKVYPNPSNDVFNISCEGLKQLELLNIYGQVIMTETVNENNHQIDLTDYPSGAYMLRIITDNGVVLKKLVKNN